MTEDGLKEFEISGARERYEIWLKKEGRGEILMAHARKRNQTWQARWRLRSGKESKDGFPTKKAAEAYGFQQEQLEKRYKNTKTSDLNLTVKEFIEDVWVGTLKVRKQTLLS
jgi:hypothetical protein